MNTSFAKDSAAVPAFLSGNSEMQQRTRAFDWNTTPLGPINGWPQSLCTAVGIVLHSGFPMFLYWGPEFISFYNDAFRQSLGHDGKHPGALGKRGPDVWPESWPVTKPQIDQVMAGGEATWQEDQLIPIYRNGRMEEVYWTYSFSPVMDESSGVAGVLVTCQETVTKVRNQQKLAESEARLKLLSDTVPAMIFYLDSEERYRFYNQQYMDWFGVNDTDSLGKTVREFVGEEAYKSLAPYLRSAYAGNVEHFQVPAPARLTGANWLNITYTPHKDGDGTVLGVIVLATDVTESADAATALRQSEEKYRTLFETMDQGFCIIKMLFDEKGKPVDYLFIEANQVFSGQTGLVNVIGKTAKELVPGLEDKWFQMYGSVALTGEAMRFVDGSETMGRWFDVYAFRVGEPKERRVAILFTDITERKRAENKLRQSELQLQKQVDERTKDLADANSSLKQSNKELTRSNRNLEEFAHAASHDLKEPIRKIHFFTAQLKEQLGNRLTDSETRVFGRIENATERMGTLIDDLLTYSQISHLEMDKEPVDLNKELKQVLEDLEVQIDEKGAVIEVEELPVVQGYCRQLQQLLQNLITNSLKYTPPGQAPQITIASCDAEKEGKPFRCLSVKDKGIGFEQEYAEKIFGMFTRLHGKSEYSGTGVGLSIVKKVVENHDGLIEVESEPGQGATFRVYLPS